MAISAATKTAADALAVNRVKVLRRFNLFFFILMGT